MCRDCLRLHCCLSLELCKIHYTSWSPLYFLWIHLCGLSELGVTLKIGIQNNILARKTASTDVMCWSPCPKNNIKSLWNFCREAWNYFQRTTIVVWNYSRGLHCMTRGRILLRHDVALFPFYFLRLDALMVSYGFSALHTCILGMFLIVQTRPLM